MSDAAIVYVHGMWMPGEEMIFLKRHLESQHGFEGHLFRYPSVRGSLEENTELLADFVANVDASVVHLVGHSLGGVLALRMLSLNPESKPGRVVCLGSPLSGSRAAEVLYRTDWGSVILGKTIADGVVHKAANEWAGGVIDDREVGSIAGTTPVGIGRLVANFKEANDGTVAVVETELAGLKDHICLPHSHSTLVMSREVADHVAAFLTGGEFLRGNPA
ncbi:MAG: alpha/beta hydrolase [Gammaproteobacteria bacterium]|nr:MAG: alpha/beta hydrolase [Gammaproteobacteria bacterium]